MAEALGAFGSEDFSPADVTHIACTEIPEEPTEFPCRWRQRGNGQWNDRQAILARSGDGWQLIDAPSSRP